MLPISSSPEGKVTEVSALQPSKAFSLMVLIPEPMTTDERAAQFLNEVLPRLVTLSGIVTLVKARQFSKALLKTLVTLSGIVILVKAVKPLKAFAEIATKEFLFVPDKDAFDSYDDILTDIKKYDTSWQIYLEVGATASVLAWDLSHQGYHALDMGDFYKRSLCTCGEDAD